MMNLLANVPGWAEANWATRLVFDLQPYLYVIFALVAAVSVGYAVYLGFMLAKAEDEGKRKQAKSRIIKTLAGLFIIMVLSTFILPLGTGGVPLLVSSGMLGDVRDMTPGVEYRIVLETPTGHRARLYLDDARGGVPLILQKRNNGVSLGAWESVEVSVGSDYMYAWSGGGIGSVSRTGNVFDRFSATDVGSVTVTSYDKSGSVIAQITIEIIHRRIYQDWWRLHLGNSVTGSVTVSRAAASSGLTVVFERAYMENNVFGWEEMSVTSNAFSLARESGTTYFAITGQVVRIFGDGNTALTIVVTEGIATNVRARLTINVSS